MSVLFRPGYGPGEHDEVCPMRKCTACRTGNFDECEATDVEHPCWCVPIRMGRNAALQEITWDLRYYLDTNRAVVCGGRHARSLA